MDLLAITCRVLGPDDLDALTGAPEGLFDHPVDRAQAMAFLADPGHIIVFAWCWADVAGFASATILLHPDKPPAGFINEIGVREEFRRRGIGRAVSEALFAEVRARGCQGIWLGTEPDNDAALALYRAMGGDEVPFVGFGWDGALDE